MNFDKTVIFMICVTILFAFAMSSIISYLPVDEKTQINTLKGLNIEKIYDAEWDSMPDEFYLEKKEDGRYHWVDENGTDTGVVAWDYINTPNVTSV